jgi:hypothetical protein
LVHGAYPVVLLRAAEPAARGWLVRAYQCCRDDDMAKAFVQSGNAALIGAVGLSANVRVSGRSPSVR